MSSHSASNSSPTGVPATSDRRAEESTPELRTPNANAAILFDPNPPTRYVPPSGTPFAHRWKLEGRAQMNNAAETSYFCKHRALVYHFVDIHNAEVDGDGNLKSCILRCGVCGKGNWRWKKGGKTKGSTTNMNNHMNEKHHSIWQAGVQSDRAAWSILPVTKSNDAVLAGPLLATPPTFNLDEFYTRLTRWFVKGNKPFTEIENEEFRDLLLYLSPDLAGRLVNSNGIRERAEAMVSSTKHLGHTKCHSSTLEDSD